MRRPHLLAGSLVVVTCAGPAVAQAPRPTVSIERRALVFGESTTLFGALPDGAGDAGAQVDVIRRVLPDTKYTRVLRGTADAAGNTSFPITPTSNSYYGIATRTQTSLAYLVHVRPSIGVQVSDATPTRDERVRFAGLVKPALDGTIVNVQRLRLGGRWQTVGVTRLVDTAAENSFYTMRVRVPATGFYRVTVKGTATLDAGASAPKRLRVR